MTRYCTYCGGPITDAKRLRQGTPYCCRDHAVKFKNERRAEMAATHCRLCGRVYKAKKTAKTAETASAPGAQIEVIEP